MSRGFNYDLEIARSIIPYIRPIRNNCDQWPEAYCDVTTAAIYYHVPGWDYACGKVEGRLHIWLKRGHLNVDFTAAQFPSLHRALVNIDGYNCIFGTDQYLISLGYTISHPAECADTVRGAGMEIAFREHGNLNPQGWCRNF